MKYVLFGLAALTLTGCTVATHRSGDYASLSIMADNYIRGDICRTFSISEEHELIRQLNDPNIETVMISDHLVEKYGKIATLDCYTKIITHFNKSTQLLIESVEEYGELDPVY